MKTISAYLSLALLVPLVAYCADDALPKAEDVFDRFVEVTGGTKAYAKIRNRREKAESRFTFQEGVARDVLDDEAPNHRRGRGKNPDGTSFEWGYHEGIAWVIGNKGPSIQTGNNAQWEAFYASFDLDSNWRRHYSKLNVAARVSFEGVDCYKLDVTSKSGLSLTQYFEVKTGLRRGVADERKFAHGTRQATRVFSDYREVDGLLIPHKMVATNRILETGVEWTTTLKTLSVEHNIDFPKGHFQPPASIKALLKKGADESEK